ncbi:hypothetical protein KR059_012474, partial [Drosophila kikkawai]
PMALADENHLEYVKQVVQDWRESVRERRNMDLYSATSSLVVSEKNMHFTDSKPRGRGNPMGTSERRESSFYHQTFSKGNNPVEIERSEGNTESDRIRVGNDVNLYLHQPVPINNAIRASLQ